MSAEDEEEVVESWRSPTGQIWDLSDDLSMNLGALAPNLHPLDAGITMCSSALRMCVC